MALKLLASAGLFGLVGIAAGAGTMSSLNDTTSNPSNSFASGTVKIGDNDAGTSLAGFSAGRPGSTSTGCINVTYTGTLPANVRVSQTTTGSDLGNYIDTVVTRGSFSGTPAAGSCTGFTADSASYGNGAGIIFTGLLSSLSNAVVDPQASAPKTWATGETHAYKITTTLRNDAFAQGKSATTSFVWSAENT